MYWDVVSVKVLEAYKIRVKFSDNREGVVSISKNWLAGVFAPLIDMEFFSKA